jgi:hypothetical protein
MRAQPDHQQAIVFDPMTKFVMSDAMTATVGAPWPELAARRPRQDRS